jgi:hypothetical protein
MPEKGTEAHSMKVKPILIRSSHGNQVVAGAWLTKETAAGWREGRQRASYPETYTMQISTTRKPHTFRSELNNVEDKDEKQRATIAKATAVLRGA